MADEATSADSYLERMKAGRDAAATLKHRLIQLKSSAPSITIFAFEGDDDKVVYAQWIGRSHPNLKYEPFPCKGKDGVLKLLSAVLRDLADVADNVYFFIDKDFDGLRGIEPSSQLFMTDAYSVENYLVSDVVLLSLLRNEFHCHEKPKAREQILDIFNQVYDEFLNVTKSLNCHIFIARRCRIGIQSSLPSKLNAIAHLDLRSAKPPAVPPELMLKLEKAPSEADSQTYELEFEKLSPRQNYRGKFALMFFERWLEELAIEYEKGDGGLFAGTDFSARVRRRELVMSNFASKSEMPVGLNIFLDGIVAAQQEDGLSSADFS